MRETQLDALEYLRSLALPEVDPPEEIRELDGAALWAVGEDHFLLLVCEEHEHQGFRQLARVIPAEWENFLSVRNPEVGFQIHHYGPAL